MGTQTMVSYFCKTTGIKAPPPNALDAWGEGWVFPTNDLLEMCGDDDDETKALIDETIVYMDDNGLTYARPSSLVNVARTIANGQHAGQAEEARILELISNG